MKKLSLLELDRDSVAEFKAKEKMPVALVLDNVRSALNVGSAFRTSDAFLVKEIILCGITAQPPHREILKTAIGATDSVEWIYFKENAKAIQYLKEKQYQILAIEQTNESVNLQDFTIAENENYALVMGNEVFGVSDDFISQCDTALEIPMMGTKHSLNVSVCTGVVIWQFFDKLMLKK